MFWYWISCCKCGIMWYIFNFSCLFFVMSVDFIKGEIEDGIWLVW